MRSRLLVSLVSLGLGLGIRAQDPPPPTPSSPVEASSEKAGVPSDLAEKLSAASAAWKGAEELAKQHLLDAFDAEANKLSKSKRESDATEQGRIKAEKRLFSDSGTMPMSDRMTKAAGQYEESVDKARTVYRAAVRKVADELTKRKLDGAAIEQRATLGRDCPFLVAPSVFARRMAKMRDDCQRQFASNHKASEVRLILEQLSNLIQRCERHQLAAGELPREVDALRKNINDSKPMKRESNPNQDQLRALLVELEVVMTPPKNEQ